MDETDAATNYVPPKKETVPVAQEKEKEDVVAKYKRLLAMARSSLEANQASLIDKDSQIKKLKKQLEDDSQKSKQLQLHIQQLQQQQQQQQQQGRSLGDDDGENVPRQILRQLTVDGTTHILLEYAGAACKDTWLQFRSDVELRDWIQRVPGVPLVLPQKCLTVEESARIEAESKRSVERIVEEFRRYKVRSEIARKQRDSEQRHVSSSSPAPPSPSPLSSAMPVVIEQARSDGTRGAGAAGGCLEGEALTAEVRELISKETSRWRQAYEAVTKENEQLRHREGSSLQASQWRERYDICLAEKEELLEKLRLAGGGGGGGDTVSSGKGGSGGGGGGGKSFQQMYVELKEEFREFHARVLALEKERERKKELRRQGGGAGEEKERRRRILPHGEAAAAVEAGGGGGAGAAKLEYIKNLILQYLCCKDAVVRNHMEMAIVQMFRFSEDERQAIEERKRGEENYEEALLASITSFVSSAFFTSSTSSGS